MSAPLPGWFSSEQDRPIAAQLDAGIRGLLLDTHYGDDDLRRFAHPPRAGLSFARERPARRFDLILLLDVVEHVSDDLAFVSSFANHSLAPGGSVLVSVPAWPALFSRHDEALAHFRRYTPRGCHALLASAGLVVRRSGGAFHSLVLARALTVAHERLLGRLGRRPPPPPNLGQWRCGPTVSALVSATLAADNALSRGLASAGLPFPGLSFWALAERRAGGSS